MTSLYENIVKMLESNKPKEEISDTVFYATFRKKRVSTFPDG